MSLGMLTATLRVLRDVETKISALTPLSETKAVSSLSDACRKRLRLTLISAAVGGIEFCYAAETALVSPLLLQLGVPTYLMSLCWVASPLLGFFLVPFLGTCSDTCGSKLGRRRPFIIVYSIGIMLGLLLVPYGNDLGHLLGDVQAAKYSNYSTVNSSMTTTPSVRHSTHTSGIIFTIFGVILLDFCCDACQIPCRTLMIDSTVQSDHTSGLTTFTVVAGLGGSIGYLLGGLQWRKPNLLTDPDFFIHIHYVFGAVLIAFVFCFLLTVCSVKENPLLRNRESPSRVYQQLYNRSSSQSTPDCDDSDSSEWEQSSDGGSHVIEREASTLSRITEKTENSLQAHRSSQNTLYQSDVSQTSESIQSLHTGDQYNMPTSCPPSMMSIDDLAILDVDMKTFLRSIIFMPKHMWILCLTNLFCWMSLVSYSLYFTDFMGQCVFLGDPNGEIDGFARQEYDKGVRMGSFAMVLYSVSCTLYSLLIDRLINLLSTRVVYVSGQIVFALGMTALAITRNVYVAFVSSVTTGIMYATLFTMPYILVAKYHCDPEFSKIHTASKDGRFRGRGLGTDIAIVSSMVFIGQFILSLVIGPVTHAAGSTVVVPICSAVLSFCGAVCAIKVEYVSK